MTPAILTTFAQTGRHLCAGTWRSIGQSIDACPVDAVLSPQQALIRTGRNAMSGDRADVCLEQTYEPIDAIGDLFAASIHIPWRHAKAIKTLQIVRAEVAISASGAQREYGSADTAALM